jgi:hypothetical protein
MLAVIAVGCATCLAICHLACSAPFDPPADAKPPTNPSLANDPPRSLSPLKPGTWTYNVIDGQHKANTVTQILALGPSDTTSPWRRASSADHVIAHLRQEPDGAIVMTANEILDHDVINTFDPPLVVLPAPKSLGSRVHLISKVVTRLRDGPKIQVDHGSAELTLTPLGSEKLVTPAGVFACCKFQLDLHLKFGLGEVQSVAVLDYADGVGLVSESDYQRTTSFFIASTITRRFVLQAYPH